MVFACILSELGIEHYENYNTAALSTIKAGGFAALIAYPKSQTELISLIRIAKAFPIKYKVIGGCSNTYFSDSGFDGMIISTKKLDCFTKKGNLLTLDAGFTLSSAIRSCAYDSIRFLPSLFGIPGTVGGAVRNNAGAFGEELSEAFVEAKLYNPENDKILFLNSEDMMFSYRNSILQNSSLVLLSASFSVQYDDKSTLLRIISKTSEQRRAKQPSSPSLGSYFKRSADVIPAKLIDEAGLKNTFIGGACVSPKHAGFIVNLGNATATDVKKLSEYVADRIFSIYGIMLTPEAEYVV